MNLWKRVQKLVDFSSISDKIHHEFCGGNRNEAFFVLDTGVDSRV